MLKILFIILFISLIIKIFYTNIEKFSVSIQNASNASNASLTPEQNASAIDIHDSNISASEIKKIFDTTNIQNKKNVIMDLRDLYQNLCPLDYNINMIKLEQLSTKVNQYPGYSENIYIDLTRQIKSDKPLPTSADFFK
tara:strand:+ start:1102 stop:1518 length:417 start_codon:yes stop_codon:yes gene_type:complete